MSRPTVVVASANPDKVAELEELIGRRFEVVARPPDAPETIEDADTLEGNAVKKAAEIAAHTGLPALADDTGLFVEALDGRPGVFSARYAGDDASYTDNVQKLLDELGDRSDRSASFRTVVALIRPDGTGLTAEGVVAGRIAEHPEGHNGFGYDPVFRPDEGDGRTFGLMTAEEKSDLSHRARAVDALATALDQSGLEL